MNPVSSDEYRNLIVGSGEAGKYLAWTLAAQGEKTAVVERKYIGGSCPNIACLPSKNLIHSAKVASLRKRAAEFGLPGGDGIDAPAVFERKRAMVRGLVDLHRKRYHESGAELIMGHARFTAPGSLSVSLNGDGIRILHADRIFLNVGTTAAVPAIPGLREAEPLTHVAALELDRIPRHLIVLGGGYVGVELAQAFRRLGSQVTLIARNSRLLPKEDEDASDAMLALFRDEGIQVLLNTPVLSVEGHSGTACTVHTNGQSIMGTDILAALGRSPNTTGLGLELVGIELDPRGYISVNERLETTAPAVWAMGECAGSPQFTHVALDDFRVVRDNLAGREHTTTDRLIPYCVFTDPELARVGLNENQALAAGIAYQSAKIPAAAIFRTRTLSETRGFVKALISPASGQILGLTAFMAEASEVMGIAQMAMLARTPCTVLKNAVWTHPTAAEGIGLVFNEFKT